MNGAIITHQGCEEIAQMEIKELIGCVSKKKNTIVEFKTNKLQDFVLLNYKSQTAKKIIILLSEADIKPNFSKTKKALKKAVENIKIDDWIEPSQTFKVDCEREGEHEFTSTEIEREIGKELQIKTKREVSLKSPDLRIIIYIQEQKAYVGIDLSGRDLSKREYKIFTTSNSLKGTIAYSVIRMSGFKPKEKILDPMSGDGAIAIEIAIYDSKTPINFYKKEFLFQKLKPFKKVNEKAIFEQEDKLISKKKTNVYCYDYLLRNVKSCQKNAKIAGIERIMNFSKVEIEWMDTKFEEEEIDRIITHLPSESKRMEKKKIEKMYQELFYQARYVLKNKGTITIITQKDELLKEISKKDFEISKEANIYSGKQKLKIIVLQKR
ncbi:MAG: THUMP domain-containing protein [Nanoarchaeota archaeon]|nr:methyltransferase [Nanoarchaeota archaeon]MBU1849239.1 methyltransferase [Nanoarchaeota archaeon]